MNEGILMAPKLVGAISTAIGEAEVDAFVGALHRVLERRAYIDFVVIGEISRWTCCLGGL